MGVVIKSDALAGGKGVVLCDSVSEAKKVVHAFMEDPNRHGQNRSHFI